MFLVLDRAPATQTGPATPCASCSLAALGSGAGGGPVPSPDQPFCNHASELPAPRLQGETPLFPGLDT